MKIGLQAKFVILFLIYSGVLFALQWFLVLIIGLQIYSEQYVEYLSKIEIIAIHEMQLTPEELTRYGETQEKDERYHEILLYMKQLQELSNTACLYVVYHAKEGDIYLFDTSVDEQVFADAVINYEDYMESNSQERYLYSYIPDEDDIDSRTFTVLTPIFDTDENIAMLGADAYINDIFMLLAEKMVFASKVLLWLTVMGMTVLLLFVRIVIVRAIQRLKHGVQRIMEGELGVEIPSHRKDEIGEITRTFNRMSATLKGHVSKMEELNHAYQKFVPKETLEILHKDSVVDVELGNQEQTQMAVLSIEASSFDEVTQDMTSEETFVYINEMLAVMVPVVSAQGGIIAQFEKAGICSFYRGRVQRVQSAANAALQSALQICERSSEKRFAAGIAEGTVMVGIAGHSKRMNIISISREKRLSELLMQIAPKYRASVLITRHMQEQISGFAESYHARFLGYVKLSQQLVGVYDVFDSDNPEDRQFKQITKEQFEQGVALFGAGNYLEARQAFVSVLRQYRRDEAAKAYIQRCSRFLQEGTEKAEVWLEAF